MAPTLGQREPMINAWEGPMTQKLIHAKRLGFVAARLRFRKGFIRIQEHTNEVRAAARGVDGTPR